MDKLINSTITITEQTMKPSQYGGMAKLKGSDNHTYTVYEKTKDGSTSKAWSTLQSLPYGQTVQVGYAEKEGEYEGKKYISRIVRVIDPDIGNGVRNHHEHHSDTSTPESPRVEANKPLRNESSEAFGKRLAVHGYMNALLSSGKSPDEVTALLPRLLKLEDDVNKALSGETKKAEMVETVMTPPPDEDVPLPEVPFN